MLMFFSCVYFLAEKVAKSMKKFLRAYILLVKLVFWYNPYPCKFCPKTMQKMSLGTATSSVAREDRLDLQSYGYI